jgi:hypothetical protein
MKKRQEAFYVFLIVKNVTIVDVFHIVRTSNFEIVVYGVLGGRVDQVECLDIVDFGAWFVQLEFFGERAREQW